MRIVCALAAALPLLVAAACSDNNPAQPCSAEGACGPHQVVTPGTPQGQILANTYCAGCHGANFRGDAAVQSPSLSVVKTYAYDQFDLLVTTGQKLAGGTVDDVMTATGISALTPADRAALYGYLSTYVNDQ